MAGIQLHSSDRDLQDQVIRFLSDARARSTESSDNLLDENEAQRAERFSRFLARRYYRDRLRRGFRYSARLAETGQSAEHIVDSADFDSILDYCVLGSLTSSKEVGELALSQLLPLREEIWWRELLEYERAFFLQLATSEVPPVGAHPQVSSSTVLHEFGLQIPELLSRLRTEQNVGEVERKKVTLLFSRTSHGKVFVAEVDSKTRAVFKLIDGQRSLNQIAAVCDLAPEEFQRIIADLFEIGAIALPIS